MSAAYPSSTRNKHKHVTFHTMVTQRTYSNTDSHTLPQYNHMLSDKHPSLIADSGTNIHLTNKTISLRNRRPSHDEPALSASKNAIISTAKGELTIGPEEITASEAGVPESLLGLGALARKNYVSVLENQGINIIKKSDVNITYKIPPPIHGTFDHDNTWRIPVSRGNNNTDFEETKK